MYLHGCATCGIRLHCGAWGFCGCCCSMWYLVPWPGVVPRPPAMEAWSLNHWTTREVSRECNFHVKLHTNMSTLGSVLTPLHSPKLIIQKVRVIAVLLSHSVTSDSLRPRGLQHPTFPHPSPSPRVCSNSIRPSHPLPSPSIFSLQDPASGSFQRVSSSHRVAKVLELEFQHQFFQWIFWVDLL